MSDNPIVAIPEEQTNLANDLLRLWSEGQRPEVDDLIARARPLSPLQLAAVLRIDQQQRWQSGERVPVEEYQRRHPQGLSDPGALLDLIVNEFMIREQLGEQPSVEEYTTRFREHDRVIRQQIDLLHSLTTTDTPQAPTSPSILMRQLDSPSPPTSRPMPEVFGRYLIRRELGKGGMGTVYLAHDTRLDRPVALKVPRMDAGNDTALLARFYREARIAASFTHPGLCPVHDAGEVDGIHYFTMPCLTGEPLSAWLHRQGPLPEATVVRLTTRIARAMQEAHQAGVIHRDLKPANVMIRESGEPVVMDFGLARRDAAGDVRLTGPGTGVGTPAYMAPEQLGGEGAAVVGPKADIYGLGVVLYEMLVGRLPFEGSVYDVLAQVLQDPPPPPSRRRPGLDPRLEAICLKALAKSPDDRFGTMADFASALEGVAQGGGGWRWRLPGWRAAWVAVAAALLLGLAALLWAVVGRAGRVNALLQPGSRWVGDFHFLPPWTLRGNVRLVIDERDGDDFTGTYSSEDGAYQWQIAGTVSGDLVRWGYTKTIREAKPANLVGTAFVAGRIDGEQMQLDYKDGQPSEAKISLRLEK